MFNFGNLLKNSLSNDISNVGKTLTNVGSSFKLPQIIPGGLGVALSNLVAPVVKAADLPAGYSPSTSGQAGGQVLGANTQNNSPLQLQQSNGTNGGGAGNLNLTAPSFNPVPTDNADASTAAWQAAMSDLNNQGSTLDSSYNQGKTDIQNSIDSAGTSAATQKAQNDTDYGNLLKQNLQTYQDTNRQRQGIFSNLGSLDSSEFQNQQFKGDQNFGQNQSSINGDKVKQNSAVDAALTDFTNKAKSGLASLALTYQQGKNSLAAAHAQGDIQGAQNISNALTDIRQKAADINNAITTFSNQANLYKSMGYNVNTSFPTYGASGITPGLTSNFGSQLTALNNMTPAPSTGIKGQGYIIDAQGRKIDPNTGQVIG